MKRMHDTAHLAELFVKAGLIAAVAAVLLLPMTVKTNGSEAALHTGRASPVKRADELPLPPIPHLETMRWLLLQQTQKGLKIDTLLGPKFEIMGPAIVGTSTDGRVLALSGASASTPDVSGNG